MPCRPVSILELHPVRPRLKAVTSKGPLSGERLDALPAATFPRVAAMASVAKSDPDAPIKGAIWFLVSLSAIFLSLRLYCKRHGGGWHWDDLVLFASWVCVRACC